MWINFYINKNQIQAETGNAILIKLPKSDWLVLISKKCIRKGTHNGKGKYNRFEKINNKQELGKEVFIENILQKYDKAKFDLKSDNGKALIFAYSILEEKIIAYELIAENMTKIDKGLNATYKAVALDKSCTINKPLIFIKDWFSKKGEIKNQLKHEIDTAIKSFEELAEQKF